jgi:hypothetical protein
MQQNTEFINPEGLAYPVPYTVHGILLSHLVLEAECLILYTRRDDTTRGWSLV